MSGRLSQSIGSVWCSGTARCLSVLMISFLFAGLFLSPPGAQTKFPGLDKYGGANALKCRKATDWFHTEKLGSKWWLCTPAGNVFFLTGVEQVVYTVDSTYQGAIQTKYGGAQQWSIFTNQRLLTWGFNTLATGAYLLNLPFAMDSTFPPDSNGTSSQPVKLPFTLSVRPAFYSMTNPAIQGAPLLAEPVKNMLYGHSPYYTGYAGGVADYFDSAIGTWLQKELQVDPLWRSIQTSPYLNYLIGITTDDGDQMNGFGAGPDFETNPPGFNNYNLGMMVAAISPVQTANSRLGWVYKNIGIQSKYALRSYLANKYSTVEALNSAWHSNYTTFDSSGTPITGEVAGTGDGSTLTFSHTLQHRIPSRFSVQILVNGTPAGGDTGDGKVFGRDHVRGNIDYNNGEIVLNFLTSRAPSRGASITVNYVQNGWGIGTGFLDEDDRPSHRSWMGNDWVYMRTANPNVKADLNSFLGQMATQYFQACRAPLKAMFPNILYLGPDSLGTYDVPSPAPVLQAASQYLDAFLAGGPPVYTQAQMDYVEQNWGDKPYIGGFYTEANPDSALAAYPNLIGPAAYNTQTARGQAYYNTISAMVQTAHTTRGSYPYIGLTWWQYTDNWGERLNWGLVTQLDNAYDGQETVPSVVPCSPPVTRLKCGSEKGQYGDLVTWVKRANRLWLNLANSNVALEK